MKLIHIFIDGKEVECYEGQTLLWVALDHGFYIPNLCAIRERNEAYGACRLCYIEIEGEDWPVTACTIKVKEGMVVNTKGPRALRLAQTAFELILSNHPVNCAHCLKTGSCELQRIARHLRIKLLSKKYKKIIRDLPLDETSPLFIFDPNKCVLCGKCVWFCQEKLRTGTLGFAYRGFYRRVSTFGDEPIGLTDCKDRIELVEICPVGALGAKDKQRIKRIGG